MRIKISVALLLSLLQAVHSSTVYRVQGAVIDSSGDFSDLASVEKYLQNAIVGTMPDTSISVSLIRDISSITGVTLVADVESKYKRTSKEIITGLQATETIHPLAATKIAKPKRRDNGTRQRFDISIDGCKNDAVSRGNGTCDCQPFTSGVHCENVHCQSWSIMTDDAYWSDYRSSCHCPPGYSARFCEQRGGRPPVEADFELKRRTFIAVIANNPSFMNTTKNIITDLEGTIGGMQANEPGYIDSYIGVLVSGTKDRGAVMASVGTSNLTYFLEFLNETQFVTDVLSDGAQPILSAVKEALTTSTVMRSHPVVLVFANREDSSPTRPSDSILDYSVETDLRQIVLAWHAKIYFFISKDPTYTIDPSMNGYDAYRRVATASHGDLITHDPTELTQISKSFVPRLYKPEMTSVMSFVPLNSVNMNVVRDFANQKVTVTVSIDYVSGTNAAPVKVSLTNGTTTINPDPGCDGSLWKVFSLPSAWTLFSVSSTANTTVSVRMFVSSDTSFTFSHSPNTDMDNGTPNNFADYQTNLNVRAAGLDDVSLITSQAFSTKNDKLYDMQEARARSQPFTLDYQFLNIPKCKTGVYTQQFMASLQSGQEFTRVYPGYCFKSAAYPYVSPVQPTSPPKPATNMSCYQMNSNALVDPRLGEFNQMMFAVEFSALLNESFPNVAQMIEYMVEQLNDHKPHQWQYTFISFDWNGASAVISTYDADEFVNRVTAELKRAQSITKDTASTYSLDAVYLASQLVLRSPAMLNVFTATEPEGAYDTWRVPTNLQVNWYYVTEDLVVPSWTRMKNIQRQTGGRIIVTTAQQIATLRSAMYGTFFDTNVLVDTGFANCAGGAEVTFEVDASTDKIAFSLTGKNVAVVSLVDGNNVTVDLNQNLFVEFKNNASVVTSYFPDINKRAPPGKWILTVSTSEGSCLCQARVETDVAVILGFSSDPNDDLAEHLPFAQRGESTAASYIMARIVSGKEKYSIDRITINEANVDQPWNVHEDSLRSGKMHLRDNNSCAYQYRSDPIVFPRVDYIQVTIFGSYYGKSNLQRTFIYYTPQYTGEECILGEPNAAGQCQCSPNYTGALCDQPVCQNGGINSNGVCDCADSGFYGHFCQEQVIGEDPFPTTTTTSRPSSTPSTSPTHNATTFNTTTPKYNTTNMTTFAPFNVSSSVPSNSSLTTQPTINNGTLSTVSLSTLNPNATTTVSQSNMTMSTQTPLVTTTSINTTTSTAGMTTTVGMTSATVPSTKFPGNTTIPNVTKPPNDAGTSQFYLTYTVVVVFVTALFN